MKKLFNWTIGSFFRTFGRILCYIAIGFLVSLVFSGKLKISAAELTSWTTNQSLIIYDRMGTEAETSWKNNPFSWNTEFNTYPIKAIVYRLNYSGGLHDDSNYTFTWGYQMQPDSAGVKDFYIGHNASNKENVTCSEWYLNSNNYRLKDCSFTPKENYGSSEYLYIRVNFYQDYITQIRPYVYGFYIREGVNSVITDQTDKIRQEQQKTNEKLDETNDKLDETNDKLDDISDILTDDTLNDDDIRDSLNYNVSDSSFGPFTTFLTLPLTWVQNILASNQTCHPISLPLPYVDKDLILPCMNDFWNSMGALSTLIQACWLCVIGVRIFNGLFLLVVETTSSKDNDDELFKVKSWEL